MKSLSQMVTDYYDQFLLKYKCVLCNEIFENEESRRMHLIVHVGKRCDYCRRSFPTVVEYESHLNSVHFCPEFQCGQCELKFYRIEDLEYHLVLEHKTSFQICGELFAYKYRSTDRKIVAIRYNYMCEFCSKLFSTEQNIAEHKCPLYCKML